MLLCREHLSRNDISFDSDVFGFISDKIAELKDEVISTSIIMCSLVS